MQLFTEYKTNILQHFLSLVCTYVASGLVDALTVVMVDKILVYTSTLQWSQYMRETTSAEHVILTAYSDITFHNDSF